MTRQGARNREFLIYFLIYSNKLAYLQLVAGLVYKSSPPKSHGHGYFLSWRFTFFLCLKNDYSNFKAVNFFSLPHTQVHKFCFQLMGAFFHCLNSFPQFSSQSNPYSKDLFLIQRNTRFHNQFYMRNVTSLKSIIR